MSKVYTIPEGQRVYAIGDIHGYAEVLERMHEAIEADFRDRPIESATIVYLGDYIDRGPDSQGVLDKLIERELIAPHFEHIFLLGNHEGAMIDFIKDPNGERQDWLQWGGLETMVSYDVDLTGNKKVADFARGLFEKIPTIHHEFLKNLQLTHIIGDYLFVHAGIRPGIALEKQTMEDIVFLREPFLSHEGHHSHRVVHGHTGTKDNDIDVRPNRINLDTNLYKGGPLSCAALEGDDVRVLQVR